MFNVVAVENALLLEETGTVVEESICMATTLERMARCANNQMKIFFSRNDRQDKIGGATCTEKGRKRRETGGRKGAHFSKSFA